MRLGCILAAAMVATLLGVPAQAANQKDSQDCDKASNLDRKIAGCTRLINAASTSAEDRAAAYNNRGIAWKDKGDVNRAIADYSESIRLNPMSSDAYHNRGGLLSDKKEYDRAIADFNEAIKLDPKYAPSFNNRGIAWKEKGDFDRAVADYTGAIRLDPKASDAYHNRGGLLNDKKEYDRAIADFNE